MDCARVFLHFSSCVKWKEFGNTVWVTTAQVSSPAPEPRPITEAAAHQRLQRGQCGAAQLLSTGTPAAPRHLRLRIPASTSSRLGHCGRNTWTVRPIWFSKSDFHNILIFCNKCCPILTNMENLFIDLFIVIINVMTIFVVQGQICFYSSFREEF